VLGLGLVGSQAGHLLAYQIRFGAAAQNIQSSGAHAYFPPVAKTALGVAGVALIGALLLIGLARILSGRRLKSASEPSYVSLLAILFSLQLATFIAQELGEAFIASSSMGSAADLVLWGTVGQLPVAALAALALVWLLARFETAMITLRQIGAARPAPGTTPRIVLLPRPLRLQPAIVEACPAAYIKRGPPTALHS
jgi:hypothetical protein